MIRYANINDKEQILKIYEDAKELFSTLGYFQWKGTYPGKDNFLSDIKDNKVLVYDKDGVITTILTLVIKPDNNYFEIDGKWLNDEAYISIHRNATSKDYYHQGYSTLLFTEAEKYVLAMGIRNIRIDTHESNLYMQKMLEKLGYKKCGIIKLLGRTDLDNPYRIAYQKILK